MSPITNPQLQLTAVANPKAFSLFKISALYTQAKGPSDKLKAISYKNIKDIIIIETPVDTLSFSFST